MNELKTYIQCIRILCGFKMTNKILFNIHELNSLQNSFFFSEQKKSAKLLKKKKSEISK